MALQLAASIVGAGIDIHRHSNTGMAEDRTRPARPRWQLPHAGSGMIGKAGRRSLAQKSLCC